MANAKTTTPEQKAQQNFHDILKEFKDAMLITRGSTTGLHGRPMAIADTDEDGSVWFITGSDTSKVLEIEQDATALAVMQSSLKSLSVSGRAELSRDRNKIHELWKESFRVWFKGKDDPNLVLIRLNPAEAEYWDTSGAQGVKFALRFAKAYVTGQSMTDDEREDVNTHAKVQL
ncbi:MAG TPA: pyridoxamine 5'-phosphate oxidase family protein [Polyangiales bacterium]|nr:pyridoxamine 5'-phosphate oxidase family protein [Polyangiales bacterium]